MATISNANNTAQAESNEPAGQKIPASEVGWCFVHEYYTILNKDPSRLHCFYGQKSTLIHGTEGETVTPSQGEKEIKEKFQSLNLENCRVLITNVDSQASINGGILIQVLGEISNRDEAARKFAQTFFLDVQPNGYYVSNDIIRFLSDDNIEIYNGGEEAGTSTSPTGTLVEEPINVPSERSGSSYSAQNTTITGSQVISRTMEVLSSKEDETPFVNGKIGPFANNGTRSPPALTSNTNVQSSKSVHPVQNRPPLSPTVQNHNEQQTINLNKQETATTLASNAPQEAHANSQALPIQSVQTYPSRSQSTSVASSNIQRSPVTVTMQEQASIPANSESHSLQILKESQLPQGNNGQILKLKTVNVTAEQDKNGVYQVPTQNNIVSLTSGTQSQNKTQQPVNIPMQIPVQSPAVNVIPQSQANGQSLIPVADTSQVQANDQFPKSANVQLSLSRQQSSSIVQDNNDVQTTNVIKQAPTIGSQSNGQGGKSVSWSETPSSGHPINNSQQQTSTIQDDKKGDVAVSIDDSEIQNRKLSDNTSQASTKKTWASLAANEPEKWSSNALAEAKGVVASVLSKPVSQVQSQQMRDNRDRRSEGQKNNNHRNSDTSFSIYVKGVTSSMSYEQLKAAFTAFGHVKHLDVVHTKSCAFVEYNNAESYRHALEAHAINISNETVYTEERRPVRRSNGKTSRNRF